MKIIDKKLSELTPYANNPRLNDGAVDAVAASIKAFGFKVPLVVTADGVIVAGHTRLKAAQKLGLKTVPCIVADDLTPEQVRAFRLADNKVGELAGWDFEKLDLELEEIDLDMSQFGFEFEEDDSNELPINNAVDLGGRTGLENVLKFSTHQVPMSDDEAKKLEKIYQGYVDQNGVNIGFVSSLLG